MHIIFKHIDIKNFLSIGSGSYDIDNQGYVLITGINNNPDDAAKNNGSGKTACLEAIVYALTGELIRGTRDVVNKYTTGGCQVTLTFSIDGIDYKIIRTRDDDTLGTTVKFFVNNDDKSGKGIRDTEKIITDYLPDLTTDLIGSVIILGQGLPHRFTDNTPAGRKEVLEKLSRSDFMIQDIKDKLTTRETILSTELRGLDDNLLQKQTRLNMLETQLTAFNNEKDSLQPLDWDAIISDLSLTIEQAESDIVYLKNQISTTDSSIDSYKQELNTIDLALSNYSIELGKKQADELTPLQNKKLECQYQIRDLNKRITEARNIKDICPTCGQKLPDVHIVDTTPMEAEVAKLENLSEDCNKQITDLKVAYEQNLEKFKSEQATNRDALDALLAKAQTSKKDLETKLSELATNITEFKVKKSTLINQRDTFTEKLSQLTASIAETTKQISQISDEILYINKNKEEIATRLSIISKMLVIAKRDFRGFLLSEIIRYVDKRAKDYCLDIFGTDKLDFELNGNNIDISYCHKAYENLSGGEKQRIDLIIQFAIRDMLCQFMSFSCNMIALDEITDNLDSVACDNVMNMLAKKLVDIESVFIISHHSDSLNIPCDKVLYVVKNSEGVSKIS